MTTLPRLSALPPIPLRLVLVKSKDEAETLAAKSGETWYFETGGKKPARYLFIQKEKESE